MHKVDADVQLGKGGKDSLQIVLGYETEILGQHRQQRLVILKNVERGQWLYCLERPYHRTICLRGYKRFDMQAYILVLDGLDSLGMDDAGTIVG